MRNRTLLALSCTFIVLAVGVAAWITKPRIPVSDSSGQKVVQQRWSHPEIPEQKKYVGSQGCVECHAEIARSYQSHPMSQSLSSAMTARKLEDFEQASFEPPGRARYRVERTSEAQIHHEFQQRASGEVIYDQAVPVDFAVGSGARGRSYFTDRDGLLFMSPITWYTEKECWDLSPGYLADQHSRFERRVPDGCVVCHSGRMNFDRNQPHRYGSPVFREQSVGCENCHGPGQEHVEYHRREFAAAKGPDPIINPARLPAERREAVCNQCHLQGEGRILRYKKTDHDFRPGQNLHETWVTFVQGDRIVGESGTKAVSHVEQMRSSRCYEASKAELSCHSCHDPHSSPSESTRVEFYRNRCLSCHADEGCSLPPTERMSDGSQNSCIKCHMPKLNASDVPHTTQTDHRVLRKQAIHQTSPSIGRVEVFGSAANELTPLQLDRAWGLRHAELVEKSSGIDDATAALRLLTPVLVVAPDDCQVLHAMAVASKAVSDELEAERYWLECLRHQSAHEQALRGLVMLYHDQGKVELALEYIDRYLDINPWHADVHGRRAHLLGRQGRFDEGIESAKRGLELDPTLYRLYGWLSEVYEQKQQPLEAERYRQLFDTLKRPSGTSE